MVFTTDGCLATFVKEQFLDRDSIVASVDKHNPAQAVTDWLDSAANTRLLGDAVARFVRGTLDLMDEKSIQAFSKHAIDAVIDKVDLTESAAAILESLTRDNRHQALLKDSIGHLVELLKKPAAREWIAARIVAWLKAEHPKKEKILHV